MSGLDQRTKARLVDSGVLRSLPRVPGAEVGGQSVAGAGDSHRLDQGRQGRVERPSLRDKPLIVEARSPLHVEFTPREVEGRSGRDDGDAERKQRELRECPKPLKNMHRRLA